MPGTAARRRIAGASSRPSHLSSLSPMPGSFQGSTRQLWIMAAIGVAGAQRHAGLALDDGHLVAVAGEKPGGRDADHAAAENQDPHGTFIRYGVASNLLQDLLCRSVL